MINSLVTPMFYNQEGQKINLENWIIHTENALTTKFNTLSQNMSTQQTSFEGRIQLRQTNFEANMEQSFQELETSVNPAVELLKGGKQGQVLFGNGVNSTPKWDKLSLSDIQYTDNITPAIECLAYNLGSSVGLSSNTCTLAENEGAIITHVEITIDSKRYNSTNTLMIIYPAQKTSAFGDIGRHIVLVNDSIVISKGELTFTWSSISYQSNSAIRKFTYN